MSVPDNVLSWLDGDAGRRRAALILLAASILALAGAFYFQYVLGLPPCPLCLIQRWPFYAAIPAAAVAAWASPRAPGLSRLLLVLLALGFVAGAGVAVYHAGVEWKFWTGPESCSGSLSVVDDADAFLQRLQRVQIVRCDEAPWRFAGLSLAGWNVPISLGLAAVAAIGAFSAGRRRR